MRYIALILVGACSGSPAEEETGTPGPSSTPATTVSFGECEGSGSYSSAAGGPDTGSVSTVVWAEVDAASRIVAHLDDERANCCPTPTASFTVDGGDVTLDFHDTLGSSGCDCMCVFDFVVTSEAVPSGEYTLEVVYDDEPQATLPVVVP